MIYSAAGLAVIGVAAGLAFRWKVLLPIILLLPVAAIIFSVSRAFSYGETAAVVIGAEVVLQGGYFVGLLMRFVATVVIRWTGSPTALKSGRDPTAAGNDHHTAPSAGAGNGP
jgi:hypothetical protein